MLSGRAAYSQAGSPQRGAQNASSSPASQQALPPATWCSSTCPVRESGAHTVDSYLAEGGEVVGSWCRRMWRMRSDFLG